MGETSEKIKLLFLCTGNSCRSQMAEGWTRSLKNDLIDVYSAGIETHGLNPYAVKVMQEAGVDISQHDSKLVSDLVNSQEKPFDFVVTVCASAHETCPRFPGKAKILHHGFDDPPTETKNMAEEEEKIIVYRRVRDEIKEYCTQLPGILNEE